MKVWAEPFVKLRLPHIFNLRRDPFERADFNSNTYWDWMVDHVPSCICARRSWRRRSRNFVKYPPRQKAASFNLDAVLRTLSEARLTITAAAVQPDRARMRRARGEPQWRPQVRPVRAGSAMICS